MTNHNLNFTGLPLSLNGVPNLRNDCVLAAMLDTLGTLFTANLNRVILRAQAEGKNLHSDDEFTIDAEELSTLIAVQKGLRNFRDIVERNNPSWGSRNLAELMIPILDATDGEQLEKEREFVRLAETMLPFLRSENDPVSQELAAKTEEELTRARENIARIESRQRNSESPSDAADRILRELNESGTIGGNRAV